MPGTDNITLIAAIAVTAFVTIAFIGLWNSFHRFQKSAYHYLEQLEQFSPEIEATFKKLTTQSQREHALATASTFLVIDLRDRIRGKQAPATEQDLDDLIAKIMSLRAGNTETVGIPDQDGEIRSRVELNLDDQASVEAYLERLRESFLDEDGTDG